MEFITKENLAETENLFLKVIRNGLDFKTREEFLKRPPSTELIDLRPKNIPENGSNIEKLLEEFSELAADSSCFSSKNFLGFPDAGNSIAANLAGVYSVLLNQNLINQSFCSPKATMIEIETIHWLRGLIGYDLPHQYTTSAEIGGASVIGGVQANAISLLAAREKVMPNSLSNGICGDAKLIRVIVPECINHYSIRCSLSWLGLGEKSILESKINSNYKFDFEELKNTIRKSRDRGEIIMAVIAYAGDSRLQSIDNLDKLADLCSKNNLWFHVDACHGLQLLFSDKLRTRLQGIERADSVTLDPHKVLWIPYNLSYVVFKEPKSLEAIGSSSDLITKERWALGQYTPFVGSKSFNSLKLWALVKHLGKKRIGQLIEQRINFADEIKDIIDKESKLFRINETDINSVAFVYLPYFLNGKSKFSETEIEYINKVNKKIYVQIMKLGEHYIHSFVIKYLSDNFFYNAKIQVLRIMPGNAGSTIQNVKYLIKKIILLGKIYSSKKIALSSANNRKSIANSNILSDLSTRIDDLMKNKNYLALVYGSSVYKDNPFKSDVDVLIAVKDSYCTVSLRTKLKKIVTDIHKKYNLPIDDEIPFSQKLLVPFSEIDKAISCCGMDAVNGRVIIKPVEKTKSFLSSRCMKLRLIHNALTTCGMVLCGNTKKYFALRKKAMKTLIWMLAHQLPRGGFAFADLLKVLYSDGKNEGEYYLGYKKNALVSNLLENEVRDFFYEMIKENQIIKVGELYYLDQKFDFHNMEIMGIYKNQMQSK